MKRFHIPHGLVHVCMCVFEWEGGSGSVREAEDKSERSTVIYARFIVVVIVVVVNVGPVYRSQVKNHFRHVPCPGQLLQHYLQPFAEDQCAIDADDDVASLRRLGQCVRTGPAMLNLRCRISNMGGGGRGRGVRMCAGGHYASNVFLYIPPK